MKTIFFLTFLIAHAAPAYCQADPKPGAVKIINKDLLLSIPLQSVTGKNVHLTESAKKLRVFVFLSPECPLSKNYAVKLSAIKKKYNEQVSFTGIIPGKFDAKKVIEFQEDYLSSWTLYRDRTLKFTRYLQGKVTPEVIVINNQDGFIIYQGAIDDWAVSPGKTRSHYSRFYLDHALADFLSNRKILISYNKPVGCFINDF